MTFFNSLFQGPTRAFFIPLLLFNLAAPLEAYAQSCAEAIEEARKEPWERTELRPSDVAASDANIFTESLPSTVASGLVWLSAVQMARSLGSPEAFLSDAFKITVPIDLTLTAVSHAIALFPWLQRFTSGQAFGPKFEFAARAGANTVMGVSVITASWAASGIDVTSSHFLGAGALCAVVYPSLQWIKNGLFKVWPRKHDTKRLDSLSRKLPMEMDVLLKRARAQAQELNIPEELSEHSLLESVDALVLSVPYENRVGRSQWRGDFAKVEKWICEIEAQKETFFAMKDAAAVEKAAHRLKVLRRQLVNATLTDAVDPAQILALGEPFTSESSLQLHRELQNRASQKKWRIVASSFMDQMVAVGVAGGIFLYSVNHWANTGEIPWYFFNGP